MPSRLCCVCVCICAIQRRPGRRGEVEETSTMYQVFGLTIETGKSRLRARVRVVSSIMLTIIITLYQGRAQFALCCRPTFLFFFFLQYYLMFFLCLYLILHRFFLPYTLFKCPLAVFVFLIFF